MLHTRMIGTTGKLHDEVDALSESAIEAGVRASIDKINRVFLVRISRCRSEARTAIRAITVPFAKHMYWASTESAKEVERIARKAKETFDLLVSEFISKWDSDVIPEARKRMGEYFCETDYPHRSRLREYFGFDLLCFNLEQSTAMKQSAEALTRRVEEFKQEATDVLKGRFVDLISTITERLKPMPGRSGNVERMKLGESAVQGLNDFLEYANSLNLTGDKVLTEQIERVKTIVDSDNLQRASDYIHSSRKWKDKVGAEFQAAVDTLTFVPASRNARKVRKAKGAKK
jgi:hypothetical protein